MIRVAAIGDVHFSEDSRGRFTDYWSQLHKAADVFLIAGDLTTHGTTDQIDALLEEVRGVRVPIVAVLGNHDYHENKERELRLRLERNRVIVLEGESTVLTMGSYRLGIAGTKGFGGGFPGACASEFGEPEMKAFIRHTECLAERLASELKKLKCDYRIALLHYSPVSDTLQGERLEIYPFLGSYLLAEAVDSAGADLVVHGHAHLGKEKGLTAGGVPVRNVALPVLKHAYAVYHLGVREAEISDFKSEI
ncbi:MAG TPA: metallophosphoesterase [Blastocatellia bacterium]|nr:metallophosphoesterase [Blastocatellia bacterium]